MIIDLCYTTFRAMCPRPKCSSDSIELTDYRLNASTTFSIKLIHCSYVEEVNVVNSEITIDIIYTTSVFTKHSQIDCNFIDLYCFRTGTNCTFIISLKRLDISAALEFWWLPDTLEAKIISVLSHAAPVWYPYLSKQNKELLEKYERLFLKIMLPLIDHSCVHLDILCLKYVSKVRSDPAHPHHSDNIKAQTSVSPSGRRVLPQKPVCCTALRSKSIFCRYVHV